MSQIRSENTKPELILFKKLKEAGFRFKKHYPIHGKPDAVFIKERLAIFVDGEYWHGKNFSVWKNKLSPFWFKKISENIKRDKKDRQILVRQGWRVMHLWGKIIVKNPDKSVEKITKLIQIKRNSN